MFGPNNNNDRDETLARIQQAETEIEAIRKIAGIAGISVVVLHHSEQLYTYHFGFQNIATEKVADNDTLYGIGSCSKTFFAAVFAALVKEEKFEWDKPVKCYVPEMETSSDIVTNCTNLIDLLAHRTGITGPFHLTFQGDGDHLIGKQDFWTFLKKLPQASSFRGKWTYNSHGYAIAGAMLEQVTGTSLNDCLQQYVAKPLGLTRTMTALDFATEPNFAKPYSTLDDGTPFQLEDRQDFRNHFFEAAAGVYTTTNDLLKYSAEVLKASASMTDSTISTKIAEADTLFTHHIPVLNPSFHERSYALGLIRTQLPGVTGVMGDNLRILSLEELPEIGCGSQSRLTLYHQGATVGYFTSIYLFPDTQSAIIVLTNTIALGDAADWIAQALTQTLFDDRKRIDWVAMAQHTKTKTLQLYEAMAADITRGRKGAPGFPLDEYCGKYYDDTGIFFIEIYRHPKDTTELQLAFQGKQKHAFDLRFFHDDIFEWVLTRNETAKRARYHTFDVGYFQFYFLQDIDGMHKITLLAWRHDPTFGEPEIFSKSRVAELKQ